ncbi:MAG: hypothetical protein ACKN9K_01660, partial [Dolichospermum sp.]
FMTNMFSELSVLLYRLLTGINIRDSIIGSANTNISDEFVITENHFSFEKTITIIAWFSLQ